MKAEEKAKMIADQCKPCTDDFYSGIYQGVLIALKAESQPQPSMSAETTAADIVEKVHYGASISDVIHLIEEYRNQPTSFTPPRTEQEEADRLVELVSSISMSSLSECKIIAQVFTNEKIQSLQLRGLSTAFEEKVLTILKGM